MDQGAPRGLKRRKMTVVRRHWKRKVATFEVERFLMGDDRDTSVGSPRELLIVGSEDS